MFDHVKFGVSDYAASKAFFLKALKPLGVVVVSEGSPMYGVELSRKGRLHCACTKRRRDQRIFTWHLRLRIASKSKPSIARLWRRTVELTLTSRNHRDSISPTSHPTLSNEPQKPTYPTFPQ